MQYESGGSREDDPSTSKAAAASINATELEQKVLEAVVAEGPMKADNSGGANWAELEILTGMERQTISPRFAPLCRKGLLANSGKRRPGNSSRGQIVWVATEAGRAACS